MGFLPAITIIIIIIIFRCFNLKIHFHGFPRLQAEIDDLNLACTARLVAS